MKDRSLQRLANIDARFGNAIREAESRRAVPRESFEHSFRRAREAVLVPVFEEIARNLEQRGFRARIDPTEDPLGATLTLFLRSARPEGHRVGFNVIDRGLGLEVLAFLEATPPVTDVARYQPSALTRDVVEQVVVDALEHIFACAAELRE